MKFFAVLALLATFSAAHASLGSDLAPLLALLAPTLGGLDAGLQQAAGNVKAAVQNLGATAQQGLNGVADIGANTLTGAAQTVGAAPVDVEKTLWTLDHDTGLLGTADRTVFGK